jgi:hypothetical protein
MAVVERPTMSDTQTVWTVLWNRAAWSATPGAVMEISELAPGVMAALKVDRAAAVRLIATLLKQLSRLPDGARFFALEEDVIVPLPELAAARKAGRTALQAFPFEL